MIKQRFTVARREWKVYVYYDVAIEDTEVILLKLKNLGFNNSYLKSAYTILSSNKVNEGFTQSNISTKTSVIVFKRCSEASEFVSSFVHEIGHLSNHIALTYDIDLSGEEINYISGDVAKEMYDKCYKLMCDCCHYE